MSRLSRIGGRRAHWIAVAAVSSLIVTLPATALPVGSALATPAPLFSPGSGAINLHVTSSVASKVVGMSRSCLTRTAIADRLDLQAQKGRKCTGFLSDDKEDLDVKSSQARNRDIIESGDRAEHMRERP